MQGPEAPAPDRPLVCVLCEWVANRVADGLHFNRVVPEGGAELGLAAQQHRSAGLVSPHVSARARGAPAKALAGARARNARTATLYLPHSLLYFLVLFHDPSKFACF